MFTRERGRSNQERVEEGEKNRSRIIVLKTKEDSFLCLYDMMSDVF